MRRQDAEGLFTELEAVAQAGPGVDVDALRRAKQIESQIIRDPACDRYLEETARKAVGDLGIWCSASRWTRWGNDPTLFRALLLKSLRRLRFAIARADWEV